jgi:intracellular multiplication protein IcmC
MVKNNWFSLQLFRQLIKNSSVALCLTSLGYVSTAHALSFDASGADVGTMLINFAKTVPNLMRLVTALAYVMGFLFVIKGIIELKHFGESRSMMSQENGLKKPLTYLFVGAMMIYLPGSVGSGLSTFWTDPNPYGYLSGDEDKWSELTNAIFMIVQLIGTIAFIRGLLILNHTAGQGGQPGTFAKAMAHIIAGILCINLYQFLQAIFTTLGLGTLS